MDDDDEKLTLEEAEWIVWNRDQIRELGAATGAVIGPLAGDETVLFLEMVFGVGSQGSERSVKMITGGE